MDYGQVSFVEFEKKENYIPTISLTMIVKNEVKVLERCIDSVKAIVDEFVIVETGSKDGTQRNY